MENLVEVVHKADGKPPSRGLYISKKPSISQALEAQRANAVAIYQ